MADGYVRQSEAAIQDDEDILAADLNAEFDAIEAAMDATTGHNHDGTVGGGAAISYSSLLDKPTPSTSNDDSIARYNGTTGVLTDSTAYIYDNGNLDFVYTEDGSGIGPYLTLTRNSASPAASDNLGALRFMGKDSAGNTTTYGRIRAIINDPTDASEDSTLRFDVMKAGADTNIFTLSSTLATLNVPLSGSSGTFGTVVADTANMGFAGSGVVNLDKTTIWSGEVKSNVTLGYNNSTSGLTAVTVKDAIDEVVQTRAWEVISNQDYIGASVMDFINLGDFRHLKATIIGTPSAAGQNLYWRSSRDNGATFDSGASNYFISYVTVNNAYAQGSTGETAGIIAANMAAYYFASETTFINFNHGSISQTLHSLSHSSYQTPSAAQTTCMTSCFRYDLNARNAIRLYIPSATFTGSILLEGIRK